MQGFKRLDSDEVAERNLKQFTLGSTGFNSNAGALQRMHSSQSNRSNNQYMSQFAESYNYINND